MTILWVFKIRVSNLLSGLHYVFYNIWNIQDIENNLNIFLFRTLSIIYIYYEIGCKCFFFNFIVWFAKAKKMLFQAYVVQICKYAQQWTSIRWVNCQYLTICFFDLSEKWKTLLMNNFGAWPANHPRPMNFYQDIWDNRRLRCFEGFRVI